ncbi:MAG: SpoIIE family protein phosphatase [bacterium]|nr:SpoIIE family protein phosphatase [bacterium]
MEIFNNFYFNFFSVGSLILCVFGLAGALFVLTIKNKSIAAKHFGIAAGFLVLFQFAYFLGGSLYHPFAAYHRWLTPFIMLGQAHMTAFMITYPDNRHKGVSKIFLISQYIIFIIPTALFARKSYKGETVFRFDGHFWNFTDIQITKLIGLIILLFLLIFLVVMIWKMIIDKENRLTFFILGITYTLTGGIPAITHTMSNNGQIGRNVHQLNVEVTYVTGFFLLCLFFINYTKERTSFMAKIIGISLLSLQSVLLGVSYYVTRDMETFYDENHTGKTSLTIVDPERRSADLEYMLEYTFAADSLTASYNKNAVSPDRSLIKSEFINTLYYEKLQRSSNANFSSVLDALVKEKHEFFDGYKNIIKKRSGAFPAAETNKGKKITEYIDGIKRRILYQYIKINEMKEEGFLLSLQTFLKKSTEELTEFNNAITSYVNKSTFKGKELKKAVLQFHAPMNGAGVRNYRTQENGHVHFTAFMQIDPGLQKIHEAGFSYLAYREYMHPFSKKLIIMLIIVYVFILLGYPVFFYSTLIKPILVLRNGHARVMKGELDFNVSIKVRDEIGYITHSFNKMTSSLKDAKIQIDDYTNNLEEKVRSRTEELQSTMEEMEGINEQLVKTRDSLWGEMQLAKKIQTVLLPQDLTFPGYEISAYMEPADSVGGDYYDVIHVGDYYWLVIGDVSGHGVPAGLIMMMVQTSIHTALEQFPQLKPSALITVINRAIKKNIDSLDEDKYMTITVLAGIQDGEFAFSGLHQDILLYRSSSQTLEIVETEGMWIGVFDEIVVPDKVLQLHVGDSMLLHTDGITEAWKIGSVKDNRDPKKDMFGGGRLADIFQAVGGRSPDEIKKELLTELEGYQCHDDVTILIMKRVQ